MKDKLESLAQSAKDSVGGGAGAVRDAVGRLSEIGTLSSEAAKTLADDLNELLPAIRRAGYSVTGIDIDVAIPPHIAVHCQLQTEVAETERQALLDSLEGRRLAASAIRALFPGGRPAEAAVGGRPEADGRHSGPGRESGGEGAVPVVRSDNASQSLNMK
ncbi:MAG: hypothetical protein IPI48_11055 [bacterium]|nr:hypothetical protein [bacterium]